MPGELRMNLKSVGLKRSLSPRFHTVELPLHFAPAQLGQCHPYKFTQAGGGLGIQHIYFIKIARQDT